MALGHRRRSAEPLVLPRPFGCLVRSVGLADPARPLAVGHASRAWEGFFCAWWTPTLGTCAWEYGAGERTLSKRFQPLGWDLALACCRCAGTGGSAARPPLSAWQQVNVAAASGLAAQGDRRPAAPPRASRPERHLPAQVFGPPSLALACLGRTLPVGCRHLPRPRFA